jgi:4-hydroxy-4-methyl-2-oxoglutarate aldolase
MSQKGFSLLDTTSTSRDAAVALPKPPSFHRRHDSRAGDIAFRSVNSNYANQLLSLGTATLGESGAALLHPRIRPVWHGAVVAAPAFTVACAPGDNLAIHAGVARSPRGYALVVAFDDATERGYWGEVLTTGAQAAGISALIIDGPVRDVAAIERHQFPAFARGIALRGATKSGPGATGGPVVIGEHIITTGDWIVADADGIVVIGRDSLEAVLASGLERASKEEQFFKELGAGKTTVDLLSLDITSIKAH